MNLDELYSALQDLPIAEIRYFDVIGSTNDAALEWSTQQATDNLLVVADAQTAGRGRMNRKWMTYPGSSLAFSLVLHPTPKELEHFTLFSPLGALSIWSALSKYYNLTAEIKWPNDILINRKKTAGILVEARWKSDHLESVVLGIGINIAPESVPLTTENLFPATCIEAENQCPIDRIELLHSILVELFAWRPLIGSKLFLETWNNHLAFSGEWVRIDQPMGQPIIGQITGINSEGKLTLKTQTEEIKSVAVGDVHLRPSNEHSTTTHGG